MIYRCCLCAAAGESREGRIRFEHGYAVPLCASHFSASHWRMRQPEVTTPTPPSWYEQVAMTRTALVGAQ